MTSDELVVETFDFDSWCVATTQRHIPMQISAPNRDRFRASMRMRTLSGIDIFDIETDAHVAKRTPALLQQDDTRVYGITVQISGASSIEQDGVSCVLNAGDYAIYDSTRPFTREFPEHCRVMIMRFPHNMLMLPTHSLSTITATRLAADEGLGVVVSPFLIEAARNLQELQGWAGVRLAHSMIDLVTSALAEKLNLAEREQGDSRTQAFLAISEYILDNLPDAQMNPDSIAQANFISTRQLHKLFHAQKTTVSQWIRERRLEQCRRDLSDPTEAGRSVSEIASSWGIFDGAHFSRIFRAAYDMSPREYRRAALTGAQVDVA